MGLREGLLCVKKKTSCVERYFVVSDERIAYFTSEEEFESGHGPRGNLYFTDIQKLEINDEGFILRLPTSDLELRESPNGDSISAWIGVIQTLIKDAKKKAKAEAKEKGEEKEEKKEKKEEKKKKKKKKSSALIPL